MDLPKASDAAKYATGDDRARTLTNRGSIKGAGMAEIREVACECGAFQARGTLEEIVPLVQAHGVALHNMDVSADQVLAMSTVVVD